MESTRKPGGSYFWEQQYNGLLSDAQAASCLLAHQMLGYISLPNQPADGDTVTLTVNGTAIPFTAKATLGSNAGNVARGGSAAAFGANLIALAKNPQFTTSTGVALSVANQKLLSYLGFALVGTTLYIYSLNSNIWSPLTSFTASVSTAGDSYSAQTMQLFVEPGNYWLNGARVAFAGGATPTVTAPSANPRIDVLTIDSSGTLAWTAGAENASPSVPAYPANKIPLVELYNVVGETALYDNYNQQAGQGYISNDIRNYLAYVQNPTAIASNLIPDADGTRDLGANSTKWNNIYGKSIYQNGNPIASARFGGSGADGALSISSGTTTIDLGGAQVYEKNYTSISITGTGKLAFTNPNANGTIIILRSQGNVAISSSTVPAIDVSNLGGNAGTSGTGNIKNPTAGGTGSGNTPGTAGQGVGLTVSISLKFIPLITGSGGGSSNGQESVSGGRGGGCLYIECAGTYNCSSTIWAKGQNGTNPAGPSGVTAGSGGGAGGGIVILYNILGSDTGTYLVTAGNGGTGFVQAGCGSSSSYASAGGGACINNGNSGSSGGSCSAPSGGNGATGFTLIGLNTLLA